MAPSDARRPGHVGQQRLRGGVGLHGSIVEPGEVPRREVANRARALARQRQDAGPARRERRLRRRQPRRQRHRHGPRGSGRAPVLRGAVEIAVLLDHDVGVRPRDAEGVDPGQPRPAVAARPVGHLRRHLQRQLVPVEAGIGVVEVQVLGDHAPLEGQRRLHQARDPRGRLQVADVGLDRSDEQGLIRGPPPAEDVRCGVDLDRVAHGGARAVRLQVVDLGGRDAGVRQRGLHHLHQRRRVRHGQSDAGAAVVHRRPPDDRPDAIARGLGVAQPLQHDDAAALAPHVAVGGGVERLALPVGRQHHRVGPQLVDAAVEDGLHAARDGQVGLALLQVRHGVVDRHHGRGAGRVDRLGRPHQPQDERDAPAGAVQVRAAEGVERAGGLRRPGRVDDQHPVLVVADPGVDAGAALLQPLRVDARILERQPARLEHHALLRVEQLRLDRRDAEEGGVELLDVVDEGAVAAGLVGQIRVAEEEGHASLTGSGDGLRHGVPARLQQPPEGVQVGRAGEAAGHADDRDRVPLAGGWVDRGTSGIVRGHPALPSSTSRTRWDGPSRASIARGSRRIARPGGRTL